MTTEELIRLHDILATDESDLGHLARKCLVDRTVLAEALHVIAYGTKRKAVAVVAAKALRNVGSPVAKLFGLPVVMSDDKTKGNS